MSSEVVDERFYPLSQLLGCHRAGNKRGTGGGPGGCSPSGLAGAKHLISTDVETVCSFRYLDIASDREALRAGGVVNLDVAVCGDAHPLTNCRGSHT